MSIPIIFRSVLDTPLHVLADGSALPGQVLDAVVSHDPLFQGARRVTEARFVEYDPAQWSELENTAARVLIILSTSLAQTVAGTVARAVTCDCDEGEQYRDLRSMRRAELAENAAEEAAVARAFMGADAVPAVVIWDRDPRAGLYYTGRHRPNPAMQATL